MGCSAQDLKEVQGSIGAVYALVLVHCLHLHSYRRMVTLLDGLVRVIKGQEDFPDEKPGGCVPENVRHQLRLPGRSWEVSYLGE